MTEALDELLADLAAENESLEEILLTIPPAAWQLETPAEGWSIRDQVSHLEFVDRRGILALTEPERFAAAANEDRSDSAAFERSQLQLGRTRTPSDVLDSWKASRTELAAALRSLEPATRIPWYGPPMSGRSFATARLMEAFAHGVDVRDAVAVPLAPSRRLRHVAHLGWLTRGWSYTVRGLPPSDAPIAVSLEDGDERYTYGDPAADQYVRGPLIDFCLVVTQRRHVDDVSLEWHGADADAWLRIAQAFAGSPGPGRQPQSTVGEPDRAFGSPSARLAH